MNITGSFILFAIFVIAYGIIIEVFTVLFRLTGLTQEKAKTQVISMLTNSGFTTSESEIILSSKKRRKLAQMTMIFGYSFTVIIVSVIVNMFLSLNQTEVKHLAGTIIFIVPIAVASFFILRLQVVKTKLDHVIEKYGNKVMFGKQSNPVILIDYYGTSAMVEIFLENLPAFLINTKLVDSKLKEDFDIHILSVKRNGKKMAQVNGNTILLPNDNIFLFGNYKNIRSVFEHPKKE